MEKLVTFDDCPVGLFMFGGELCIMTEYATESVPEPNVRQRDAYVVSSGEYFWGGTSLPSDRNKLMVEPVAFVEALSASRQSGMEEAAKIAEQTTAYDDDLNKSAGTSTTGQRIAQSIRTASRSLLDAGKGET